MLLCLLYCSNVVWQQTLHNSRHCGGRCLIYKSFINRIPPVVLRGNSLSYVHNSGLKTLLLSVYLLCVCVFVSVGMVYVHERRMKYYNLHNDATNVAFNKECTHCVSQNQNKDLAAFRTKLKFLFSQIKTNDVKYNLVEI